MIRELLGKGFLYFIGLVFGLTLMTRLNWLGVPPWITILAGIVMGLAIGRFLTHEGPKP